MNWYFEQQGVSHGPLPESELVLMLRRREITHETLIWHPGMERWQEILTLKPEWMVTPSVEAAVAPVKVAEKAGASMQAKRENSVQAGKPALQKTAAPILKPFEQKDERVAAAEEVKKPGLLKKLFGLGKKKA